VKRALLRRSSAAQVRKISTVAPSKPMVQLAVSSTWLVTNLRRAMRAATVVGSASSAYSAR